MTIGHYYLTTIVLLLVVAIGSIFLCAESRIIFSLSGQRQLPLRILFLFPAVMLPLGFLPAAAVFLFAAARHNKKSWSYSFSVCLVIPTIIYAIFHFILGKSLPLGFVVRFLEI